MKKNIFLCAIFTFAGTLLLFSGCKNNASSDDNDDVKAISEVRVTTIFHKNIADEITLSAISSFLIKDEARAVANGYIENIKINIGDKVKKGQVLFTMQTKEASAIGNGSDSTFSFSGILKITANRDGIITAVDHQKGDYVQDGDQLCTIADENSIVFLVSVPYELHNFIKINEVCKIQLPDSTYVKAIIDNRLPIMDEVSQTENFIVKPLSTKQLPENLIAKIIIPKTAKKMAAVLPKKAILTNETQTVFWVMKLINDSTAVKIPITKGMESNNDVEIVSPVFSDSDRIIFSGNYGLADTASVKISKE